MSGSGRRARVAGCCMLAALACRCADYAAAPNDAPNGSDGGTGDGGTNADGATTTTDSGDAGSDGATRWCDGGHTFCADFDDLAPGDPPYKGWTEATRDTIGSTASLIQSESLSAPNAARIQLPNAANTYFTLRQTTDTGTIKTAKLTFAMRLEASAVADAAGLAYHVAHLLLRDVNGMQQANVDIEWAANNVRGIAWIGGAGVVSDIWSPKTGALSYADWVIGNIAVDLVAHTVSYRILDSMGIVLAQKDQGNLVWPETRSITIEVGSWSSDQVRPATTLTFDNVALDVTR